jgi:hypothetical protein
VVRPEDPRVTPATLIAAAADLRDCAKRLRDACAGLEGLLVPARGLDDGDTWDGPYPRRAGDQLGSWATRLGSAVADLRAQAAQWEWLASDLDRQAADARKAGQRQPVRR